MIFLVMYCEVQGGSSKQHNARLKKTRVSRSRKKVIAVPMPTLALQKAPYRVQAYKGRLVITRHVQVSI
jgi:hypothetical protein